MAPPSLQIRISEAEAELAKQTLRMNVIAKDAETMSDEVRAVSAAVFGDRHNPNERPGIVHEVRELRKSVTAIQESINKLMWLIVGGIVAAVLSQIIKH